MYQNIREEELKNKIASDYFDGFDTTKIIGNVDFCITSKTDKKQQTLFPTQSLLWAEAKKGKSNIYTSFVQLILTIGKARTFDKELPPSYLGAFDAYQIAFIPYNQIQEIFYQNDFNWNVTPSNYETKEFKQIHSKVEQILTSQSLIFTYQTDHQELKEFIKTNFVLGKSETSKIQIDKNNFISVYNKWLKVVKPTINIVNWKLANKDGIIDGYFYIADLLSDGNLSLKENLFVILQENIYKYNKTLNKYGSSRYDQVGFADQGKAHTQFWNHYERPPREEYWNYILDRQDLLVPQDIRERKGSFFTPQIWVEKSQEYLTDVLGENWQDEYYIWDCCSGTGNLLAGLVNKYNIYASSIDQADIDVIKDRIETMNQSSATGHGANLLENHIFQFDFLNDEFTDEKVPESLRKILQDTEKRKKLVIYINPPYAEATTAATVTKTGANKAGVSTGNKSNEKYRDKIGNATNEIFALFMARIYDELSGSKLAQFSKLKFISGTNFKKFRSFFLAKYLGGFIVPADTFDNVKGTFPIGFAIWDLDQKDEMNEVKTEVFEKKGEFKGQKSFYGELPESINKWFVKFQDKSENNIGLLSNYPPDFQNQNKVFIQNKEMARGNPIKITQKNLIPMSIYLAVRHCIKATWLNDRDQFLFPNENWKTDTEFQNDCLAFTLFHGQNRISSKIPLLRGGSEADGVDTQTINHWIPFTETEVNAPERFESHFMTEFMGGKLKLEKSDDLMSKLETKVKAGKLEFSPEAKAVFEAGQELWKYYFENIGDVKSTPSSLRDATPQEGNLGKSKNPSLYDIKAYFQGVNDKGRMNNSSKDEKYNELIANLRENLEILGAKIQPKVYEFGFLKG